MLVVVGALVMVPIPFAPLLWASAAGTGRTSPRRPAAVSGTLGRARPPSGLPTRSQ